MKLCSVAALVLGLGMAANALGQEKKADPADALKQNPDDVQAINEYVGTQLRSAMMTAMQDPKKGLEIMNQLGTTLEALEPTKPEAQQLVGYAKAAVKQYRTRIELQLTTLDELTAKLGEKPGDVKAIELYGAKISQEAGSLARSQPEKAETLLADARKFLADLREKVQENAEAIKAIDAASNPFDQIARRIASAKKLKELIGKNATELVVDAWVNGSPLTDEDLKGKVVLLDFWAVWCGPCKATFPHLREWHEKYADKGLEIIGVTSYYGLVWDDEKGDFTRGEGEVTPEQEQEMLAKFAEANNLPYRIAVEKDGKLAEFYGVTGIPHAVVIDREGKIRLIKVGAGEANAKEIGALLEQLIGDKA